MTKPPLPILALRQDATRPIADLLEALLHKDVASRPANGKEAAAVVRDTRAERESTLHESYRPPTAQDLDAQALPTRIVTQQNTRAGAYGLGRDGEQSDGEQSDGED